MSASVSTEVMERFGCADVVVPVTVHRLVTDGGKGRFAFVNRSSVMVCGERQAAASIWIWWECRCRTAREITRVVEGGGYEEGA